MIVKIKKINDNAVLPSKSTDGSAGYDITACEIVEKGHYLEAKTGLSFEIPEGYVGLLFPRSSISNKPNRMLLNSVGVLDSDYRGEVTFRFSLNDIENRYKVGEKIGQIVIIKHELIEFLEVNELSDTGRGSGGYGSTGV